MQYTKSGVITQGRLSTIRGVANTERPSEMKSMAGLRLKAARLALGVDRQDVMANVLGVQVSAYNNWEKGHRLPDVAAMVRLLNKSGISLDWIFAGELRSIPFDLSSKLEQLAIELGAAISRPASFAPEAGHNPRIGVVSTKRADRVLHEGQDPFSR